MTLEEEIRLAIETASLRFIDDGQPMKNSSILTKLMAKEVVAVLEKRAMREEEEDEAVKIMMRAFSAHFSSSLVQPVDRMLAAYRSLTSRCIIVDRGM